MVWYIFLAIIIVLAVLLVIPIVADISYLNGRVILNIKYAVFKFKILPKKEKKNKHKKIKKNNKKSSKDELEEEPKKKTIKEKLDTLSMLYDMAKIALDSAKTPLRRFLRSFKIYDIEIYLRIGGDDAEQVVTNFIRCNQLFHAIHSLLCNAFTLEIKKIYIEPDFMNGNSSQVSELKMRMKPISIITVGLGFGIRFGWKFFISKIKENKDEKIQNV